MGPPHNAMHWHGVEDQISCTHVVIAASMNGKVTLKFIRCNGEGLSLPSEG